MAIKNNILKLANRRADIKAVIEIGSQARSYERADIYSDLDILLISEQVEDYLDGDGVLREVGEIKISFTEKTVGGAAERRILFDRAQDVDFILMTPKQCLQLLDVR